MENSRANDEYGVEYTGTLVVTKEDIDDIMSAAIESGGIAYWCDSALPRGERLGEYAIEQISLGGKLELHLTEGPIEDGGPEAYLLDREMVLKGISRYLSYPENDCGILFHNGIRMELDTGDVDAEIADMIIQYALFDELVFG